MKLGGVPRTERRLHSCTSIRILNGASWWKLDLFCLTATMLIVVFVPAIHGRLLPIAKLLQLRISLLNFLLACLCVSAWRLVLSVTTLRLDHAHTTVELLAAQLVAKAALGAVVAGSVLRVAHPGRAAGSTFLAFLGIAITLLCLSRAIHLSAIALVRPRFRRKRQVVIVGSGWRALDVAERLTKHPRWDYRLLGFIDSDPQTQGLSILGGIDDLAPVLMRMAVDEVIITLPVKSKYDEIQAAVTACESAGVQIGYSMDLFAMGITKRRSLDEHNDASVVLHMVHDDKRHVFKRMLDLIGAAVGLVGLSPVLLCVSFAIRLTSPGPILFRQTRYGLNKQQFTMLKFRSMTVDAESRQRELEHLNEVAGPTFKMRCDPRITPVGRFLRQTSLDELPQLLNVLRGDMSLVGPRPLPMRDVGNFSEPWLMRRFSVKPGLTGLWQVSGRSNSTFAQWMALDLEYIDRWTFLLDVKILARTFPAVLKRDGAV